MRLSIIYMKNLLLSFILLAFTIESSTAQQKPDTTSLFPPVNKDYAVDSVPHLRKTKLGPSMIIPGALIVYGLTTMKNSGIYSSYQAQKDIQKAVGGRGAPVDDWLQYSPYAEFAALLLLKVKCMT